MPNQYLDLFNQLPAAWKRSGPLRELVEEDMPSEYLNARHEICTSYSYSVPTDAALETIRRHVDDLLDFGAGSGYWASLLEPLGIKVDCYEPNHTEMCWHTTTLDPTSSPSRNLMLIWPLRQDPMASEALALRDWDTVVYIGEVLRGCGNLRFFNDLWQRYELVDWCRIPQWFNRSDAVYIFQR